VQELKNTQQALGFSALKAGSFLKLEIDNVIPKSFKSKYIINTDYHFGGYAKYNTELISFINDFFQLNNIKLDFVYTAKMMFGLTELIKQDYFPQKSVIVAIHSGGLQGNEGIGI
jgi:1-aminocyclopropane-1-carboxylate deaminase